MQNTYQQGLAAQQQQMFPGYPQNYAYNAANTAYNYPGYAAGTMQVGQPLSFPCFFCEHDHHRITFSAAAHLYLSRWIWAVAHVLGTTVMRF